MGEFLSGKALTAAHTFAQNPAAHLMSNNPLWLTKVAPTETNVANFNIADLDVTDPESLIAFFGIQMTEAKNSLTAMMADQDARTKKSQKIQAGLATLAKWENGSPTDPAQKAEFIQTCEDLKAELPASEAQKIDALVDPIKNAKTQSSVYVDTGRDFSAYNSAQQDRVLHEGEGATVTETKDSEGRTVYTTTWTPNALPLNKNQMTDITNTAKSYSDSLTTKSQMAMIQIQQGVDRMTQLNNFCTNILKKRNDADENVISNLR